ncbi:hypothetical protein PAHAL_2G041700 [Panicum hallii]|uniref:Uncharacterized protein n=1 Tax=Panicum hallii TaxID=206008 RepID=A0A270R7F2_9POAL|nr:hypothetical protein PAHAL_2G041700 [Panicum hallii]
MCFFYMTAEDNCQINSRTCSCCCSTGCCLSCCLICTESAELCPNSMLCGYLILNGVQGDPARLWIARSCAVVHRYRLSSSVFSWQCCNGNIELKRMVTAMDAREIIVL